MGPFLLEGKVLLQLASLDPHTAGEAVELLGQVTGTFLGRFLGSLGESHPGSFALGHPLGGSTPYWAASPASLILKKHFSWNLMGNMNPWILNYSCSNFSFIFPTLFKCCFNN